MVRRGHGLGAAAGGGGDADVAAAAAAVHVLARTVAMETQQLPDSARLGTLPAQRRYHPACNERGLKGSFRIDTVTWELGTCPGDGRCQNMTVASRQYSRLRHGRNFDALDVSKLVLLTPLPYVAS